MLWRKFKQLWNDTRLQPKLLILFSLFIAVFVAVFLNLVYYNVNSYNHQSARVESERTQQAIVSALNSKMQRIENATQLITSNNSIENVLLGSYYSTYSFYYDLKYQYDSIITAIKLLCPEITGVNIYLDEVSERMARSSFQSIASFEEEHPNWTLGMLLQAPWQCSGRKINLYHRLYNTSSYALVEIGIDYDALLNDLTPASLEQYALTLRDKSGNTIYEKSDLTCAIAADDLIVSSSNVLGGWQMTLEQNYRNIPFSALVSGNDMAVIVVCCALALFLICLAVTRSIVNRISLVNKYLSDVVEQNFQGEIQSVGRDEIGNIARNINSMVQRTKALIEKVYTSQIMQKEAQIKMLQAQINPHFLYNTLSVLNWNAINRGDMETSDIITSLSAFYRGALNTSGVTTTLGDEIHFLKTYVELRRITCSHPFTVEFDIPERLRDYELPRILLQPIAENAIDHGIEAITGDEMGLLRVEGREDGDTIVLRITDNGPGMDGEAMLRATRPKTSGYGLYNVNERLKLFFSEQYGIHLDKQLPHGLRVTMRFPKYVSLR